MHLLYLPLPLFLSAHLKVFKVLKATRKGKKSKQGFEITPRNRTRHHAQRGSRTKQLYQYLLPMKYEIN